MDFLKYFLLVFLLLGCAKVGYIYDQGLGQLKIQMRGQSVAKVISSPKTSTEAKNKIKLIQDYKAYFYHYFNTPLTGIYSKVTFLEDKAVSYLLIVSPYNEITPKVFQFPIVGDFPYLGFFKMSDAQKKKEFYDNKGYVTYIRPVYGYSTLGWFEDRILSSFFYLEEEDLAELIFHELTHTLIFFNDELSFNENIASYVGKKLLFEYYRYSETERAEYLEREKNLATLNLVVVQLITSLRDHLRSAKPKDRESARQIVDSYIRDDFLPKISKKCEELKLGQAHCYPLQGTWNQARAAEFLTYQQDQSILGHIQEKYKFSLRELVAYLKNEYKIYKNLRNKNGFVNYLKLKEKL